MTGCIIKVSKQRQRDYINIHEQRLYRSTSLKLSQKDNLTKTRERVGNVPQNSYILFYLSKIPWGRHEDMIVFCPAVYNYDQAFEKAPLSALAWMMSFQTLPRADVSACDWRADLRSVVWLLCSGQNLTAGRRNWSTAPSFRWTGHGRSVYTTALCVVTLTLN